MPESKLENAAGDIAAPAQPANATGMLLRSTREAQGLSVGDIANRLRMGVKQVSALEAGDYPALPTGTFLRGFVRNYAKTLNLSVDEVLATLEKDHASARPLKATPVVVPSQQNIKVPAPGGDLATPKARVAIAVVVVGLLFVAVWYWWEYVRPHRADGGRAPVPAVAAPASDQPVSVPVRPPEIAPPLGPVLEAGTTATDAGKALEAVPAAAGPAATPATAVAPTPSSPATAAAGGATPEPVRPTPASGSSPPAGAEPPRTGRLPGIAPPVAPAPAPVGTPSAAMQKTATSSAAANTPAGGSNTLPTRTSAPDTQGAARATGGTGVLGFTFAGESWVEVMDGNGKLVLSKRFRTGDAEEVVGRPPFSVVVGNAQVTRMAVNGREFDLAPHTKASVARVAVK